LPRGITVITITKEWGIGERNRGMGNAKTGMLK
jgi:hypothetical protein